MKKKGIKILAITLLMTLLAGTTVYAATRGVVKETESYYTLEQDVYYPIEMEKGVKYPVVFMAHNGGANKEAWGDFPQAIANEGFFTVNIGWQAWDTSNVESAINYTLEKYADVIDTENVVFVGGCHGGKDFVDILNKENTAYNVKAAVLLSVSEIDDGVLSLQNQSHVPMLVYYSLNDEYGANIEATAKRFATEVMTKPCKVVASKDPAHGNNMVTNSSEKNTIRRDIINWAKKYTK